MKRFRNGGEEMVEEGRLHQLTSGLAIIYTAPVGLEQRLARHAPPVVLGKAIAAKTAHIGGRAPPGGRYRPVAIAPRHAGG